MKKYFFLFLTFILLSVSAEKITVYRNGNSLLIQSRWSMEKDMVIHISRFANEASYLVKRNSDIRDFKKGIRLHLSSDEYPATLFAGGQGYGYLSGNHGSAFGVLLTVPDSSFSEKDIGAALQDETKKIYRIVQVISAEQILIHPESTTGILGAPKFPRLGKKKIYRNGVELKYTSMKRAQVYPMNRITRISFLVDGKTPLPNRTVVRCDFLEHQFEHDVLAPEGMIEYLKKNPGKKPYPEFAAKWKMVQMNDDPRLRDFAALQAIMTVKNKFTYQQNGAVVNERTCTYHITFPNVSQMDQMFYWGGGKIAPAKLEEFYIPKTKPLQMTSKGKTYMYDFSKIVKLPKKMPVLYTLKMSDAIDPEDLPDRYIRLSGNGKREYGIALGMSLFSGISTKANKGNERNSLYFFYPSKKMYLYSYILVRNQPGQTIRSVSYKQYFNPALEPDLTSFYYHRQETSDVVYVDCHKSLKGKILQLPLSMAGKRITVLEKTPTVTLYGGANVPSDGKFRFDVIEQGYFVLKLD